MQFSFPMSRVKVRGFGGVRETLPISLIYLTNELTRHVRPINVRKVLPKHWLLYRDLDGFGHGTSVVGKKDIWERIVFISVGTIIKISSVLVPFL